MNILDAINEVVWSYIVLALLLGCAVWFTVRTKFVQFRMIGEMLRLLAEQTPDEAENDGPHKKRHISSFQAFTLSMSSRIGVGNLAGVAIALSVGGPGAIFWMWMTSLFGAATAFVECTLSQLYKVRGESSFIGGPAHYMSRGLGRKWMPRIFALLIIVGFALVYTSVESNTIAAAMNEAFGIDQLVTGIVVTCLLTYVIFGGVHRIASFTKAVVPTMAIIYLLLTIIIMCIHITELPRMFAMILEGAFGFRQFVGGSLGTTVLIGIKRGLYSNEAGEGSTPIAAAVAKITHPVKQGLVQCLGVFTDTILVCSCTAFLILLGWDGGDFGTEGIRITQEALCYHIGPVGKSLIAIIVFFFVFPSTLGSAFYGESNVRYLTDKKSAVVMMRIGISVMALVGAVASLSFVWALADFMLALLVLCNLSAIIPLGGVAVRLLNDYRAKRRSGIKSPTFHKSDVSDIPGEVEAWN